MTLHDEMLQALIGLRMLARLEAKLGQSRWIEILPIIEDLIGRAIATQQQEALR